MHRYATLHPHYSPAAYILFPVMPLPACKPVQVTRALLALCNLNLTNHAQDRAEIHGDLLQMDAQTLRTLGRPGTLAIPDCE